MGCRKGMVQRLVALFVWVPLKHREISHPEQIKLLGYNQAKFFAQIQAQATQGLVDERPWASAKQD